MMQLLFPALALMPMLTLTEGANHTSNTNFSISAGYISSAISVIFYGSNFVPVKQYETGDGMFFQWVLSSGIFLVGLIINIYNQSVFYPLAMVGGVIWATGNLCVVPILKTIGLSLGLCIWATTSLLMGWLSSSYGWFGINQEKSHNMVMNYIALAFAVMSGITYTLVKSEVTTSDSHDPPYREVIQNEVNEGATIIDKLSPTRKRILGTVLALGSGCLYGLNFVPAIYIQDHYSGASPNGLDYVFAHFCGIYLTASTYFCIYVIFMRNRPVVYPKAILPGIISGIMWGVATACFFVANAVLLEPVSFPIITSGPMLIASAWGVLLFKEIKGLRNMLILFLAFGLTIVTAVLSGLSKVK
ncbi:transmembrane protein 144 isoform X2 [Octopus bimaculoides]|uniref:transmembrane protein 144 isoform X2 n=1 Tax=Octopus bimaculoides TaxID=37653 RepID=UPI00071CBFDD|nr:transmembrane protein 144 isoform X2 [Octopus bimaculoides]|eukprot:XP_014786458.1 PREDICTED: transmembrane protein 144-like isoform X2 [Octopus bimaculoides]